MILALLAPLAFAPALSPAPARCTPVSASAASSRFLAAPLCQVDVEIDPKVETSCGFDYVPLITALREGDFYTADQITRDGLITLAGPAAVKRGYVYFADVPKLPATDLATIDRLWLAFSNGKFGYCVQRAAWRSKKVGMKFEPFYARIGWSFSDGKLLRWLPEKRNNDFIYELDKAPKGHLPLTSTLRGTQLLQGLLEHPVWDEEEFKDVKF